MEYFFSALYLLEWGQPTIIRTQRLKPFFGIGQSSFCLQRILKMLESSKIRGSRNDSKIHLSESSTKLQTQLNSILFRLYGLPIKHPIVNPFLDPDLHSLKDFLKELIDIEPRRATFQLFLVFVSIVSFGRTAAARISRSVQAARLGAAPPLPII